MKISNHGKTAARTFPIPGNHGVTAAPPSRHAAIPGRHGFLLAGFTLFLAACGTMKTFDAGPVTDPQIAAQVKAAQASYESGGFVRAARHYELALARARALDDGPEIARNAYNAAACWLRADQPADAKPLLVEAEREFARHKMELDPVLVLKARVASAAGQADEASALASNALAVARSDAAQLDAILVQFDLALQGGDVAAAEQLVRAARRRSDASRSVSMASGVSSIEGRLLLRKSDPAGAAGKFDAAAEGWRDVGSLEAMALHLRRAGGAYSDAGDQAAAADRFYRAARSYFGQRDNVAALQCVEAALKSAGAAKDEALRAQIDALFGQIKKSVEGPGE